MKCEHDGSRHGRDGIKQDTDVALGESRRGEMFGPRHDSLVFQQKWSGDEQHHPSFQARDEETSGCTLVASYGRHHSGGIKNDPHTSRVISLAISESQVAKTCRRTPPNRRPRGNEAFRRQRQFRLVAPNRRVPSRPRGRGGPPRSPNSYQRVTAGPSNAPSGAPPNGRLV